jgi:DNA polymerase zeta
MEPFQVRLNCVDHYQTTPTEFDPPLPYRDGAAGKYDRPKVPVIRIFGATETGQKVCVHVHGAFPYLYVQYDGSLQPEDGSSRPFTFLFVSCA